MPLRSSLLIAVTALTAALAPAAAHAQDPLAGLPTVYGGGGVTGISAADKLRTTVVAIQRSGAQVTLRVSVTVPCKAYKSLDGHRGSDVIATTALNPDGSFHLANVRARTTGELGRVTLSADGRLAADRADGTAQIHSSMHCGEQVRPWSARPVDPRTPPQGAPAPADGVLYGVSTLGDHGVPHGVVAQVTGGGTQLHVATSYPTVCHERDSRGPYRYTEMTQQTFPLAVKAGVVKRDRVLHASRTDRAHGVRGTVQTRFDALFAGPAVGGSYSWSKTYSKGADRESCRASSFQFVAVP